MRNQTKEVIDALNNSPMQWKTTVPKREAGTWISHGLTLADEDEEFSVLECPVYHETVYEGEKFIGSALFAEPDWRRIVMPCRHTTLAGLDEHKGTGEDLLGKRNVFFAFPERPD